MMPYEVKLESYWLAMSHNTYIYTYYKQFLLFVFIDFKTLMLQTSID